MCDLTINYAPMISLSEFNDMFINNSQEKPVLLTVTLASGLNKLTLKQQYKKTFNVLRDIVRKNVICAYMVMEITQKGNIHYHIVIRTFGTNNITILLDDLKGCSNFGFCDISTRKHNKAACDNSDLYNYVTKDILKTYIVFNKLRAGKPIPLTQTLLPVQKVITETQTRRVNRRRKDKDLTPYITVIDTANTTINDLFFEDL